MEDKFATLVGRIITGVKIDDDRRGITFETPDGPIRYECYGDCCSSTWIEGIDDEAALLGTVTAAEEISMPDAEPPGGKFGGDTTDCVAFYGLRITTEKGRAVLDYRNDSNGYYGGSLDLVTASPRSFKVRVLDS